MDISRTYIGLRDGGLSEDAVWAVMGNLNCESNLEPCRLQGDFQTGFPASRSYAEAVDSGIKSRETFATDAKGWGLAQWTYPSRKRALWDYAKARGRSIADLELQIAFLLKELQEDFTSLYRFLQQTTNMYEAIDRFCREFENPAVKNVNARYNAAKWLRDNAGNIPADPEPEPVTDDDGIVVPETWPPRTIDSHCEGFPEIKLMQALMLCQGYNVLVDGIWTDSLTRKLKAYQTDNTLTADGICGDNTWRRMGLNI